jgi:hypothetical protein
MTAESWKGGAVQRLKLWTCRNKIPTIIERQRHLIIGRSKKNLKKVQLCCSSCYVENVEIEPPPPKKMERERERERERE